MGSVDLVLATENNHKLTEFKAILEPEFSVKGLAEVGFTKSLLPEVFDTYEENARQKASFVGVELNSWVIGDDSGFEVEALAGAPGVHSARYGGTRDSKNQRQMILQELGSTTNRRCKFVCVLALFNPLVARVEVFRGELNGTVSFLERGDFGFGYDSIVIPEGFTETLAEIPEVLKNSISHRAIALQHLRQRLFSLHNF